MRSTELVHVEGCCLHPCSLDRLLAVSIGFLSWPGNSAGQVQGISRRCCCHHPEQSRSNIEATSNLRRRRRNGCCSCPELFNSSCNFHWFRKLPCFHDSSHHVIFALCKSQSRRLLPCFDDDKWEFPKIGDTNIVP